MSVSTNCNSTIAWLHHVCEANYIILKYMHHPYHERDNCRVTSEPKPQSRTKKIHVRAISPHQQNISGGGCLPEDPYDNTAPPPTQTTRDQVSAENSLGLWYQVLWAKHPLVLLHVIIIYLQCCTFKRNSRIQNHQSEKNLWMITGKLIGKVDNTSKMRTTWFQKCLKCFKIR